MQTNNTFAILFWINRNKIRNGEAPIYVRLTVNGKRCEISTKHWIAAEQWNVVTGKAKGNVEKARTINAYLDVIKGDIQRLYDRMFVNGERITSEILKNKYLGVEEKQKILVEVFQYHNNQMKDKIGIEFAKGTYQRYEISLRKLIAFMKYQYKKSDFDLEELSHKFMADFDFYLKTVDKVEQNTSMKYIKSLKKIARLAVVNGWLSKNPFDTFKCSIKETERCFLSANDLELLSSKSFSIKRLEEVRDVFLFSCYTGYVN